MSTDIEYVPADVDPKKIYEILRRDGGLVLEGLIPLQTVNRINGELHPHVVARPPGFKEGFDDGIYGRNTIRIQGLVGKAPTFVREVLIHDALLGIADLTLKPNCGDYWMSQAETIFIGPGNPEQELHRDDVNWGPFGSLGIDLQVSVLTALGDYDEEVGATRVIPGSNNWSLDEPFDPSMTQPVEMEAGSAFVYTGSVVHGGGANRTEDRWRLGLYCSYLLSSLTPEEAVAMSITREVAAGLPKRARELLGWSSLRGNPATEGPEAAFQLWQLDQDDLARHQGLFLQREM